MLRRGREAHEAVLAISMRPLVHIVQQLANADGRVPRICQLDLGVGV